MLHFLVFDLELDLKFLDRVSVLSDHIFVAQHLASFVVQVRLQFHQFCLEDSVLALEVLAELAIVAALSLQGVHYPLLLSLVLSILAVPHPLDFEPRAIYGHQVGLLLLIQGELEVGVLPLQHLEMQPKVVQLTLDALNLGLLSPQVVREHLVVRG